MGSLSLSVWTLERISEKVAWDKSMCLHLDLGLSKDSSYIHTLFIPEADYIYK